MYNPLTLEGKTILITGASSGIGRQTAIQCSKMGAAVILTARKENFLKDVLAELDGSGHSLILADLEDNSNIDNIIQNVPELDGIVLNAGINKLAPITHIKEQDIARIVQVNAIAPAILLKALLKKKKIKKGASVVFTSSVAGNYAISIAHAAYSMSKSAINSYMKTAALELASKNIRCNSVCPGFVETKMNSELGLTEEQLKADLHANYPLGRYGKPEDIANGILFLLSDASSWMTGSSLVIDGGFTIR